MSSISSTNSNSISSLQQLLLSQSSSAGSTTPSRLGEKGGMSSKLDELLKNSGLDESQQESLKTDLKEAMKSVFESGSFPPDPTDMQSAMSGVFEKYGLDGDAMAEQLAPPPPPEGSAMPLESGSSDSLTALIETLQQSLGSSGSSQASAAIGSQNEELAELLMSALSGVNGYA